MNIKTGGWVTCKGSSVTGFVRRVARDGSWVDVDWGTHSKRMRSPESLIVQHTIPLGNGWTVTDETRKRELSSTGQAVVRANVR